MSKEPSEPTQFASPVEEMADYMADMVMAMTRDERVADAVPTPLTQAPPTQAPPTPPVVAAPAMPADALSAPTREVLRQAPAVSARTHAPAPPVREPLRPARQTKPVPPRPELPTQLPERPALRATLLPPVLTAAPQARPVPVKPAPPKETAEEIEARVNAEMIAAVGDALREEVVTDTAVAELPTAELPAIDLASTELVAADMAIPPSGDWINGRPTWAQEGFECLLFKVGGLQLAVPLVLLGSIHRLDDELTPLVGRARWFMGLLQSPHGNLRVVDTGLWVMPERYKEAMREAYKLCIRLDGGEWGLACDSVAQSFTVRPEDVRWRSERSRRPWLAGTVTQHMCALIDVSSMVGMLGASERRVRR